MKYATNQTLAPDHIFSIGKGVSLGEALGFDVLAGILQDFRRFIANVTTPLLIDVSNLFLRLTILLSLRIR